MLHVLYSQGLFAGVCIATWPADKTPYRVSGVADLEIDCAWCLLGSMLVSPDVVVARASGRTRANRAESSNSSAHPAFRAPRSHSLLTDALAAFFCLVKIRFGHSVYAYAPQRLHVYPKRPRAKAPLLTRLYA